MSSEREVVLLEFTRAMDTNDNFQSITEKWKTARYAPHCEFIASVLNSYTSSDHEERGSDPEVKAWSVTQITFTVGVQDLLHEQS